MWCDIYGLQGEQNGPYGRLLREVFGFDALTVEDCFTRSHLPKADLHDDYLFVALLPPPQEDALSSHALHRL